VSLAAAEVHQPKLIVAGNPGDISQRNIPVLNAGFMQQLHLCKQVKPGEQG
jgi:hypothetical protein